MLNKILRSLEDPIRPLLGPNYWILKTMGLILSENRVKKNVSIILHKTVTFFVLTQYIELYMIRSSMDLVLTNLKISMLSIVCIVKANTFVFWQVDWKEVFQYVTEADKFERDTRNNTTEKIIDAYTKYCRRVLYSYYVLVFITFMSVITTPLVHYLSSKTYREALKTGLELFPHIFSSWMPFDKYRSPGCWITVLWHILICTYGASIVAAYDTTVVVVMVFFGGKLELLRERCKQIFGDNRLRITDEEARKKIRQLHDIHVLLNKYSRLFNSLLSPVMFLYVVMCSLMLCASAYELTTAPNTMQTFLMAEFLIFGVAQLFTFCWHSNDVLVKSENVMLGPYESHWWESSLPQRQNVLLLAGQLRLVHTYTAGPFTNLTLSTFITILKGAYSYYTLLRK